MFPRAAREPRANAFLGGFDSDHLSGKSLCLLIILAIYPLNTHRNQLRSGSGMTEEQVHVWVPERRGSAFGVGDTRTTRAGLVTVPPGTPLGPPQRLRSAKS
jgi:hypothetical protein